MNQHWIAFEHQVETSKGAAMGSSFTGDDYDTFKPPEFQVISGTIPDLLLTFAALTQTELRTTYKTSPHKPFSRALHSFLVLLSHHLESHGEDL